YHFKLLLTLTLPLAGCVGTTAPVNSPQITSISPSSSVTGASGLTLQLTGKNFQSGATVLWSGSPRPTKFVSASALTASITAADLAKAESISVTFVNRMDGPDSNGWAFSVNASPIRITTTKLPNGTAGTKYSASLAATGGVPGYHWSLVSGNVP